MGEEPKGRRQQLPLKEEMTENRPSETNLWIAVIKLVGILDEADRNRLLKINRPGIKLYSVKKDH